MANLDNGSDDRVIGGLEQPHGGKVLVVENLVQRIDLSAGNIEFVADCLLIRCMFGRSPSCSAGRLARTLASEKNLLPST